MNIFEQVSAHDDYALQSEAVCAVDNDDSGVYAVDMKKKEVFFEPDQCIAMLGSMTQKYRSQ